jgi:mRNA-degrading endonuclease RelE of RelBE toxin-antitoxin system
VAEYFVAFAGERVKREYDSLGGDLRRFVDRAIDDLKRDPFCGTHVPRQIIPKEYKRDYGARNLWKYDLPNAWRLVYFIEADHVSVVAIVLEWMDHKSYERRFGY